MTEFSKEVWLKFQNEGIILSNDDLLQMMQDCIATYKGLNCIFNDGVKVIQQVIIQEFESLRRTARFRNMENIPDYPI